MVFGLSAKEKKVRRVSEFAGDIIIRKAVAKEKAKQALLMFERRKAKAIARIRSPPIAKLERKLRKGIKLAGKDIGRSIKGFVQKIGKPSEAEKETVIIIGGTPKRVKGRVRVIREQQEPFGGGLGVGGDLGLSVDLLSKGPKKKRRGRELKPIRFF